MLLFLIAEDHVPPSAHIFRSPVPVGGKEKRVSYALKNNLGRILQQGAFDGHEAIANCFTVTPEISIACSRDPAGEWSLLSHVNSRSDNGDVDNVFTEVGIRQNLLNVCPHGRGVATIMRAAQSDQMRDVLKTVETVTQKWLWAQVQPANNSAGAMTQERNFLIAARLENHVNRTFHLEQNSEPAFCRESP